MIRKIFFVFLSSIFVLSCMTQQKAEWFVEEFPSPAVEGSGEPSLLTGNNTLYMSWFESTEDGHDLKVAAYKDGAWDEPAVATSGTSLFVNWADFPILRNLSNDRLGIHWLEKSGESYFSYEVRVSLSDDDGKTWSNPMTPHTDRSPGEHGFVSLVTEEDGGFGAVWLDGRNIKPSSGEDGNHSTEGEMALLYGRYEYGSFVNETILDSRVCDCCQTDAVSIPGGILVVYRDRSDAEVRDMSYIRRVDGKWSGPQTLFSDHWGIAACPVNGPAADSNGNLVAVGWFTGAGGKGKVQVVFSNNGGASFEKPVQVDLGNPSGRIDLLLLEDESAVISWLENLDTKGARILIRRVYPDGRMDNPITVADSSQSRSSGFPRMSRLGKDIIVAWTRTSEPPQVRMAKVITN